MKNINIGVIGCGQRIFGIMERVLAKTPGANVAAGCDPLARQLDLYRDHFNRAMATYRNGDDFFNHPGLDWIVIGSWNNRHRAHVEAAAKRGLPIYCEKPLATTLEDVEAILDTVRKTRVPFMVGFTLRYSPFYRKIKSLLDGGSIGRLVSFEFNETLNFNHGGFIMRDWRRHTVVSGGHLLEKCCHDIDLANWMVGSLPLRVAAFGGNNFFTPANRARMDAIGADPRGLPAYCTWPTVGDAVDTPFDDDHDLMDNEVAILEYANRVRATFHTNMNAGIPERRMYLLGSEGAVRADVLTGVIELQRIGFGTAIERIDMKQAGGGHGGGDEGLTTHLSRMMSEGAPSLTPVENGASSAVICLAVDESVKQGRVVNLGPIWERLEISGCGKEYETAFSGTHAFSTAESADARILRSGVS